MASQGQTSPSSQLFMSHLFSSQITKNMLPSLEIQSTKHKLIRFNSNLVSITLISWKGEYIHQSRVTPNPLAYKKANGGMKLPNLNVKEDEIPCPVCWRRQDRARSGRLEAGRDRPVALLLDFRP
ncbi:unnamed protein product [Nezara viridula]|uniref:Uncharacterized protein n=1 Tax=Nezara viridula TaxID=85310 RepID=A0A9P0MRQ0_NEZVI|nr:unnamed protein product [Nezara viridula]